MFSTVKDFRYLAQELTPIEVREKYKNTIKVSVDKFFDCSPSIYVIFIFLGDHLAEHILQAL